MYKQEFGIKQATNVWYDIKPKKPTSNNDLTVCKQIADVKMNC